MKKVTSHEYAQFITEHEPALEPVKLSKGYGWRMIDTDLVQAKRITKEGKTVYKIKK